MANHSTSSAREGLSGGKQLSGGAQLSEGSGALDYVAPKGCQKCPRLYNFITQQKGANPAWYNGAVPAFGANDAQIVIVGLAPGLRGANATGRPFTGDFAGETLYQALLKHGFASGDYQKHAQDGLQLHNLRITNAVKCVPPQNKPTADEVNQCRDAYLIDELARMKNLKVILALGGIAHKAMIKTFGKSQSAHPFGHLKHYQMSDDITLLDSYHCSRYNVQTNRLTIAMFDKVMLQLKTMI